MGSDGPRRSRNLGRPGHRVDGDRRGRRRAVGSEGAAPRAAAVRRCWAPCATRSPIYGSGGFTAYSSSGCPSSSRGWVEQGIPRVKMKVGSSPERGPRPRAAAREAIGPSAELVRRRERRLLAQAGARARRALRATTPASAGSRSRCPPTTRGTAAAPRPRARGDGDRRRRVRLRRCRTSSGCSRRAPSTCCRRT